MRDVTGKEIPVQIGPRRAGDRQEQEAVGSGQEQGQEYSKVKINGSDLGSLPSFL